jgi:hypothetical protein
MQGSCFGHENPDMWFSDTSDQVGSGAPSASESNRRLSDALQALAICNTCPAKAKAQCLILGMKDENLDNGIWGGTLSGERLLAQRSDIRAYDRKARIAFAKKVRQAQGVTL